MRKNFTILGLLLVFLLHAQETLVVSGVVLNSENNPVKDVRITITGQKPAYTDSLGRFEIAKEKGRNWMTISSLGAYKDKKILLDNQKDLKIFLVDDDLDSRFDALKTPLGMVERGDLISSSKELDVSTSYEKPYVSVDQYLQGRVSGAYVTQNSGMPGSGASVYLRGYSSLLMNNQPLYVVDGIPLENSSVYDELIEGYNYNPLTSIDPNDISEITVLKDAEATALWGAKGANGVICITTLEPQESKTTIDVMYRTGLTTAPQQIPQLNSEQYKNLANEVLFSSGLHLEEIKENYSGLYYTPEDDGYVDFQHHTNWQDEVYNSATMQNLRFSIKGGDAIAKYGLSVAYLKNEGVIKNTSMDRVNIRLVGAFEIFSWLKMDLASSLTTNNSQLKESGVSQVTSPILSALSKSPLLNPYEYDSDGNRLSTIAEVEAFGVSNPRAVVDLFSGEAKNYRFTATVNLKADITDDFKFQSLVGLNTNNLKEYSFTPDRGFSLLYDGDIYNTTKAQNSNLKSLYNDNQFYYKKTFNTLHALRAGLGLRWQKTAYDLDQGVGKNTPSDYYQNLNRGTWLPEIAAGSRNWNWGSVYANVAYDYANKYLLTATATGDFSSRLGTGAKHTATINDIPVANFYSIGAAWRLSEEAFLNQMPNVEEIKLRASYGVSGNDDIGETNTYAYYQEDQYRETAVLVPGGLANKQLTYQSKRQMNVGLDLGLFANRLSLTADVFSNKSKDLMFYEKVNVYHGSSFYPNNSAIVATKGVELNVMWRAVKTKEFTLDYGVNFSKYASVVEAVPEGINTISSYGQVQYIHQKDAPVNSFYGYKFKGVYGTYEEAQQAAMYTDGGLPFERGDAVYENADASDNVINSKDKQVLGSFEPDFYGGMFLNARYKRWSFNAFFQGVYGNEVYNYVRYTNERMSGLSNQSIKTLQRWQYEGQVTDVPKATAGDPKGNSDFSSRWIEDGSYLRLKELSLCYDVKKSFAGLSGMQVFATATNLFTLTNYTGYDPEFSYSQNLMHQGVDYGLTPITKQFMLGIKIGL